MAISTAGHAPGRSGTHLGGGRIAALVAVSLGALLALALLLAGLVLIWAHTTQRDDDGFYTSNVERLATPTAALTAEGLHLGDLDGGGGEEVVDAVSPTVRIRAQADTGPVFVGIARERDVDAYLQGVAHDEVRDVDGGDVATRRHGGRAAAVERPARQNFWVASASGPGRQSVTWDAEGGDWAAVVMNADGSRRVAVDADVAARTGVLLPVGIGLLIGGALLLAGGGVIAWLVLRGTAGGAGGGGVGGGPPVAAAWGAPVGATGPGTPGAETDALVSGTPATAVGAVPHAYPVAVEARLDEPLSRWLWLVKWFLAIPHWIVLTVLWMTFCVTAFVGIIATAVTGRYPRSLFQFNTGVMRWSWRVVFYATGVIGTDRYPPFTLERTDYPAELEIPYPERLPRGRVLVQWLLALPHVLLLIPLYGVWNATWTWGGLDVQPPGVVTVLVAVAAVLLLVGRRYPPEVFRLLVGIHRWLYRVIAYAAGMRSEYPPFRLER